MRPTAARRRGEEVARQLLERRSLSRPPVPVREIAIAEGCLVKAAFLDGELSGMAFITDDRPVIVVNSRHHPNRQRFTIAHELGHHLMHRSMLLSGVHVDKGILRRDAESSTGEISSEIQANAFAAELLMPRQLMQPYLSGSFDVEDDIAVHRLAEMFGVSTAAMTNRILNLSY